MRSLRSLSRCGRPEKKAKAAGITCGFAKKRKNEKEEKSIFVLLSYGEDVKKISE